MPLIKKGRAVKDRWRTIDRGADLPRGEAIVICLNRWQADRKNLMAHDGPLGIRLESDQAPEAIVEDLDRFDLIALTFAKFTDGRAYSHARLLRERYGFRGELRAVGNVLRDQLLFMHRCGFDAFEVADDKTAEAWLEAMAEISVWYQPAADRRPPVWALRRGRTSPRCLPMSSCQAG